MMKSCNRLAGIALAVTTLTACASAPPQVIQIIRPIQPVYIYVPYDPDAYENCGEVSQADCWYEPDDGPGET